MKFDLAVLVLLSSLLVVFAQKDDKAPGPVASGLGSLMSTLNTQIWPGVAQKRDQMRKIIDEHRRPFTENLEELREKMSEYMMNAGFDVLEKGLDFAEILQNISQRVKTEVLNLPPTKK